MVGSSGAGKTTLAAALADNLGLAHIELDSIYHQPGWVQTEHDEFVSGVEARMEAANNRWVVCGNYINAGKGIQTARADTIVWVDLGRPLVTWRVTSRTVRRAITREELWNGNREPASNFYRWDPELNVIRWSWTQFGSTQDYYELMSTDGTWAHADVHRLRTRAQVGNFLSSTA